MLSLKPSDKCKAEKNPGKTFSFNWNDKKCLSCNSVPAYLERILTGHKSHSYSDLLWGQIPVSIIIFLTIATNATKARVRARIFQKLRITLLQKHTSLGPEICHRDWNAAGDTNIPVYASILVPFPIPGEPRGQRWRGPRGRERLKFWVSNFHLTL